MREEKRGINKKAQLSVFIILGLLILIVLIALFMRKPDFLSIFLGKSPFEKIKECSQDSLKEGLQLVTEQGGSVEPENYYLYNSKKVGYVCYNEESFKACVMQQPFLKNNIEEKLKNYVQPKIKECLNDVKIDLEKRGGKVEFKEPKINVEIIPGSVLFNIESDLKIEKEAVETYKNIKIDANSNIYNLIITASSIANNEAKYGDDDTTTYMIKDKSLKVEKIKQGDETKIYILTDRKTKEKFYFAIKSIPIPPGWIEPEKFEK